jgi:hypothetical protein
MKIFNFLSNSSTPVKSFLGHTQRLYKAFYFESIDKFVSVAGDFDLRIWNAAICKYYCQSCSDQFECL